MRKGLALSLSEDVGLRQLGVYQIGTAWHSSRFKNNHFTEMCSGSETGSYLRLRDPCLNRLKAQGTSRTCNESQEEKEEEGVRAEHPPAGIAIASFPSKCE